MNGIGRGCGITLALVCLMAPLLRAQTWIHPETVIPFRHSGGGGDSVVFLGSTQFGGEAARVFGKNEDHRWIVMIGGAVELVRQDNVRLLFESAIALVADPGNNIGFNPRALFWEEGILIGLRGGNTDWQFGLQHRCKHDIDNIELLRVTGREEERALIYSSLMLRWQHDGITLGGITIQPLAEAHAYVFVQDQRFPVSARTAAPNVEDHRAASRVRLDISAPIVSTMRVGVLLDARGTLRRAASGESGTTHLEVAADAALAEVYTEIRGSAAALRLFLRAAHLPDTFIRPVPRGATLYSVGVRIVP